MRAEIKSQILVKQNFVSSGLKVYFCLLIFFFGAVWPKIITICFMTALNVS